MKNLKKRKVIISIILIVSVIIGIKIFTDSRANRLLDINVNVIDSSGLLDVEESILQAKSEESSGYFIVLPDYINGKYIEKYLIEEKTINGETLSNSDVVIDDEYTEDEDNKDNKDNKDNNNTNSNNTISENEESKNKNENISSEDNTNQIKENNNKEEIKDSDEELENEEKDIDNNEENEENEEDIIDEKGRIIKSPGEMIYLTNEEVENKKIDLIVSYDKIEKNNKTLYMKCLEQELDGKNIIVEGYMPVDSEVKVELSQKENVDELLEKYVSQNGQVKVVYDIKIFSQGVEYQPEEYQEHVNVYVTDLESIDTTKQQYKVVHIDGEDNTEEIKDVETREDSVEFRANSFSDYAIILDDATGTDDFAPVVKAPELINLGATLSSEADVWDGSVATGFSLGNGSQANPYLISSGAELAYLAQRVNAGTNFAGQVFQLTKDINLNNREWTPIGDISHSFAGIFNGSGRTIANGTITISGGVDNATVHSIGFFGSLGRGSTYAIVRNVAFHNINITCSVDGSTNTNATTAKGYNIGIVTGRMYNHSQVSNVSVTGSKIEATRRIRVRSRAFQFMTGGICGQALNKTSLNGSTVTDNVNDPGNGARYIIENCYVQANILTDNVEDYYTNRKYNLYQVQAGGIIGTIRTQAVWPDTCLYSGNITGNAFIGPIFGGLIYTATTGQNTNYFSAYWNGNQAGGNLIINSYYTNYRVNGRVFTDTVTSGSSTAYVGSTVSNNYLDGIKGVNKGIYISNISTFYNNLNNNNVSNVVWEYDDNDLRLIPRLTSNVTQTVTNTYSATITDRYAIGTYTYKWYKNGVQDTSATGTTYTCSPNYIEDQNIIFLAFDGEYYTLVKFTVERLYVDLAFNIDTSNDSVTAYFVGTALPYINPATDYTYVWYKEDISGEGEIIEGANGLVLTGLEEYYDYHLIATNNSIPQLSADNRFTYGDRIVIFCDYGNGSDSRDGLTPATAVRKLSTAYSKLDGNGNRNKNVIVIMGNYTDTAYFNSKTDTTYKKEATIIGKYGGVDYNGNLRMTGTKYLTDATTFMYLIFNGNNGNCMFYCSGQDLTIGEQVTMTNYTRLSSGYGTIDDYGINFQLMGGELSPSSSQISNDKNNNTIIIKSGTYGRVIVSGRSESGNSIPVYGTESNPFVCNLIVNIQNSTTTYNTNAYDINLLVAGKNTGSVYAEITMDCNKGKIGRIVGGNLGRSYNASSTVPLNSYYGSTTMNLNGASVKELYGASLGRERAIDVYYYGTIEINIDGSDISSSIYGGGAGGATGYDDDNGDRFKSDGLSYLNSKGLSCSSAKITLDSGTISGSIYGGGYGNSTNLTGYSHVMGNFFGDTEIYVNGGTVTGSIYGAGEGYYRSGYTDIAQLKGDTYVEITGGTISGNIYGAGQGIANHTNIAKLIGNSTVKIDYGSNNTLASNIYGGASIANMEGNSTVNIVSGKITGTIYGGGDNGIITGNTNVNISGGTNTLVYGGGNKATVVDTTVSVTGGTTTTLYGGGNSATARNTTVTFTSGTATTIYGGGNQAAVTKSTVNLNGGSNETTYGGGNQAGATETHVTCNGTTFSKIVDGNNVAAVFGGSNTSGVVATSSVIVNSGTIPTVYGGNNQGGSTTTANVEVNNGTITDVFGGGNQATAGTTYVTIEGGTITKAYGGGNKAAVTTTHIDLNGGTITTGFGGGNQAGATTTNITVDGATVSESIFGGSNNSGTVTTSNVVVDSGSVVTVFGGNNIGGNTNTSNVGVTGGTITDVYGGGNEAVTGETNVNITGNISRNVYGGGKLAAINSDTNVNITGATIGDNVYGGGDLGVVGGDTYVHIKNCKLMDSLYAGGNGTAAIVEGNTNLVMEGTTNTVTNSVFGGGNQAATGVAPESSGEGEGEGDDDPDTTSTSISTVKIVGGTIGGNVYGGANTSVVYGTTYVYIGYDAVGDTNLQKGDVIIEGTVFGGGEANASGSETYDFSFISVTQGINIYIDGNGHNRFNLKGSIFGSGNASSAKGDSLIVIQNYGTNFNPQSNISIQRANLVKVSNSAIALAGTTDRTNEYSTVKFSLSRIDKLQLINGATLYLVNGTNLLKEFDSLYDSNGILVDGGEEKAAVTIDPDTGDIIDPDTGDPAVPNADNRLYVLEGVNVNIATNQSVTTYGKVQGMTFFGMFTSKLSPGSSTGFYTYDYQNGDTIVNAGTFSKNSYVKGAHLTNHDITVDGFYSNYRSEKDENNNYIDNLIHTAYVPVTPLDDVYYKWEIGEALDVQVIEMTLTASKFATFGTQELKLDGFSVPNTTFSMYGFSSGLNEGIQLITPNSIESIELDPDKVDSLFGLTMRSGNSGWASSGTTTFVSTDGGKYSGKRDYKKDNSSFTPSFNFCFYHSQNLTLQQELGDVTIRMYVSIPINDLEDRSLYLDIVITMNTQLIQDDFYEGAITPGQEYGLFTTTDTTITSKSTFSSYYSLLVSNAIKDPATLQEGEENKYADYSTFKRVLVSRNALDEPYPLPLNTKITMLDMVTNKYYYYIVNSTDVSNHKYVFNLADFTAMGSTDGGFNESAANALYYNSTQNIIYENFIFHTSFADANLSSDIENNSLLIELRNNEDETIVSVLGVQRDDLRYTVYTNKDATIRLTGTVTPDVLYLGNILNINAETELTQSIVNTKSVFDTQFFDQKLGIKISIYDNDDNRLNSDTLFGVYFELDGQAYYPRIDGTTRINIADKVTDVLARLKMHTENNTIIETGDYKIVIESFGSPDGIYYGLEASDSIELDVTIIKSSFGLNVSTPDENKIVNKTTGITKNNTNTITSTIEYSSGLENPNITVSLYRRDYSSIYALNYQIVDLASYVTDALTQSAFTNEYVVTDTPTQTITQQLHLTTNLTSGTYKLVYKLYDGNNYVGEAFDYIVIK